MKTIFVSDIFGLTHALTRLAEQIVPTPVILDPYHGHMHHFSTGTEAYARFMSVCGLAH